jgi:hypothetical protein
VVNVLFVYETGDAGSSMATTKKMLIIRTEKEK